MIKLYIFDLLFDFGYDLALFFCGNKFFIHSSVNLIKNIINRFIVDNNKIIGGYYPYMYNAMGYGWGIQYPSFNYQTIVQNPPPIIINNVPPSQPIYQNGCDHECERMRNYFRKR